MRKNNIKNEDFSKRGCLNGIVYWTLLIIGCTLSFSVITLIPHHNNIKFPEYWYEPIFIFSLGYWPIQIYFGFIHFQNVMKCSDMAVKRKMFYMFVMTSTATVTCYIAMYLIWGIYLQFLLPLPFIGFVNGYICTVVLVVGFWYQISYRLRTNLVFRKRLMAYFCYWAVELSIPFQVLGIQLMIPRLGSNIQWIIAFVFLLKKELNTYVMKRLICNFSGSNVFDAKAIMTIQIAAAYTFTVVTLISSSVNQLTSYIFLGVDFVENLYVTLKIVKLHQSVKVNYTDGPQTQEIPNKIKEMVTNLIINEGVEFLVPISYIVAFIMVYYGPNAKYFGNVQNDYWQYIKVDNLLGYLTAATQMALIDLMNVLISVVLLWKFCAIILLQECRKIVQRYGLLFTVYVFLLMNKVMYVG